MGQWSCLAVRDKPRKDISDLARNIPVHACSNPYQSQTICACISRITTMKASHSESPIGFLQRLFL